MVKWVAPNEENLRQEYKIEYQKHIRSQFGELFPTYEDFANAVHTARVETLTRAADARIQNRSHTRNRQQLLSLIKSYRSYPVHRNEKTIDHLIDVISGKTPGTMTMPIVLEFPDGDRHIMSGNTRLDIAWWYHDRVPVVVVPVQASMWESLLHEVLDEGVDDPHIFKAIFLAGGPGSGKSTISRRLFGWTGLRFVDVDKFFEVFQKIQRTGDYPRFWELTKTRAEGWVAGRLGLVFDGTGRDLESIKKHKAMLEELGYETAMIFVNTDLSTAKARVKSRERKTGRSVPESLVVSSWNSAQQNLGAFQSLFNQRFYIVDNSTTPDLTSVERWIRRFLSDPIRNPIAREWFKQQRPPK